MKKKKLLLIALLLVWVAPSFAAKVDTLLIKSPSMNKDVQVVVVTPDAALGKKAVACPTIYLLHGYGGNAKTWIDIKPNLPQIADEKGIIFVCPDGKNSWYWDSPINPSFRYETFISSELVKYIDEHYKTTADQYISIILTGNMFRDIYAKKGYESCLLSRTTEDAVTVTSVLIPWNSCGMTQATILSVPTLVYLPYCFFNIISPLMSITVAAIGYKIARRS